MKSVKKAGFITPRFPNGCMRKHLINDSMTQVKCHVIDYPIIITVHFCRRPFVYQIVSEVVGRGKIFAVVIREIDELKSCIGITFGVDREVRT